MKPVQVFDESPESVAISADFRAWYLSTIPEGRSSVNLTRYLSGEYIVPEVQAMYKAFCKIASERSELVDCLRGFALCKPGDPTSENALRHAEAILAKVAA